jgi:sialic acid synthase SpsE
MQWVMELLNQERTHNDIQHYHNPDLDLYSSPNDEAILDIIDRLEQEMEKIQSQVSENKESIQNVADRVLKIIQQIPTKA